MDKQGFRQFLQLRQLTEEQMEQHTAVVTQFEAYLAGLTPQQSMDCASGEAIQAFIDILTSDSAHAYNNLLALGRWGLYSKNTPVYLSALEPLDGHEVFGNMHARVGEVIGSEQRDEIFEDVPFPPVGLPNGEKARRMKVVMERLDLAVSAETQSQIFANCFRHLPDAYFQSDRQKYWEIGDFDRYLEMKRSEFIGELEQLMAADRPYFNQPVTQDVIDFVSADPEISQGVRKGDILYITKIPYMAHQYLSENDPKMKRYACCHCPWARESLRDGGSPVSANFCQCSAGFVKKPWEVIFGMPLQTDVLESALKGDLRCRFAIHLPEVAVRNGSC